jgi:hypothetical protein
MIKYAQYSLTLIVAFCILRDNSVAAPPRKVKEQLLSFTYAFDTKLRPLVERKLLVTPGNYGRMIRMHGPSNVGESVVSVHCGTESKDFNAMCQVTVTRATANMDYIWQEHQGDDNASRYVQDIPIVRRDAQIAKSLAEAFRQCLRVMIPEPGDPNVLHPLTIADNDRIEFWLEDSPSAPLKGERAEQPGVRTKKLIHIGDLLSRYCEASQSEREVIAEKVKQEAAYILSGGD